MSKKQTRRFVKGFFPNEKFPKCFSKIINNDFVAVLQTLSNWLYADPAYPFSKLRMEVGALLKNYNIDGDKAFEDSILVCICVLLHNAEFMLPDKSVGVLTMRIDGDPRNIPEYGVINIVGMNDVPWKTTSVSVILSVLTTDISILPYIDYWIDAESFSINSNIVFDKPLSYDSSDEYPVKNTF